MPSNGNKPVGSVMVVGGGGGIKAAENLSSQGFYVYLVEKTPAIGVMAQLDKTFPTNDCSMCIPSPCLVATGRHPNIEILSYTDIESVSGESGHFKVKVRRYAGEEKRMMGDLRYGLVFGTRKFADDIRKRFLPDTPYKDLPQQRLLSKDFQPADLIDGISKTLQIDVNKFITSERVRGIEKQNRDLIVYFIWNTGRLSNTEIGALLNMGYSSVSHSVKSFKEKVNKNNKLKQQLENLKSQFKL
jgi:hypothetical protein